MDRKPWRRGTPGRGGTAAVIVYDIPGPDGKRVLRAVPFSRFFSPPFCFARGVSATGFITYHYYRRASRHYNNINNVYTRARICPTVVHVRHGLRIMFLVKYNNISSLRFSVCKYDYDARVPRASRGTHAADMIEIRLRS